MVRGACLSSLAMSGFLNRRCRCRNYRACAPSHSGWNSLGARVDLRALQQVAQGRQVLGAHLLLLAIRAKALHLAAHVTAAPRRANRPARRPASPQTTRFPFCAMKADICPTLPATTMSIPFIEMPQRDAGIALDHQAARHARSPRHTGWHRPRRSRCRSSCSRPRPARRCR